MVNLEEFGELVDGIRNELQDKILKGDRDGLPDVLLYINGEYREVNHVDLSNNHVVIYAVMDADDDKPSGPMYDEMTEVR